MQLDYGLSGKTAVVCASSQGLGRECAFALAQAGCTVVINGRDRQKLEATAEEIRCGSGKPVIPVAGDLELEATQEELIGAVPQVDILVNNNGGPPYRSFDELGRADILQGLIANMVVPIELVQRVLPGMVHRRFGRIVNITSASVRMPLPGLDLSSGARAGLTAFLAGVARTVAHANVTINFLLPGAFETKRLETSMAAAAARSERDAASVRAERMEAIPARRFGSPQEFGAACAFLCSEQAGYITGQSLLIDGGTFPGVS